MLLKARNTLTTLALLATLLILTPSATIALPDDRQQSVTIKADSTERDEKNGITTFEGDVIIEQGSLSIAADKVVVYGAKSISRIIATGKPAKLKQRPDLEKGFVTAKGNKIEYSFTTEIVELTANAYIHQDGTELSGNNISYDMAKRVFKAKGVNEADRVSVVMQPEAIEDKSQSAKPAEKKAPPAAKVQQ